MLRCGAQSSAMPRLSTGFWGLEREIYRIGRDPGRAAPGDIRGTGRGRLGKAALCAPPCASPDLVRHRARNSPVPSRLSASKASSTISPVASLTSSARPSGDARRPSIRPERDWRVRIPPSHAAHPLALVQQRVRLPLLGFERLTSSSGTRARRMYCCRRQNNPSTTVLLRA